MNKFTALTFSVLLMNGFMKADFGEFTTGFGSTHNNIYMDPVDKYGDTLLHLAKTEREVQELLNNGADPNAQNNQGYTPLHYAALYNSPELFNALLKHPKTNVNARNAFDITVLICAINGGSPEKLEALLLHPDINVNAKNKNGTALDHAVYLGWTEPIKLLKAHGAISQSTELPPKLQ